MHWKLIFVNGLASAHHKPVETGEEIELEKEQSIDSM